MVKNANQISGITINVNVKEKIHKKTCLKTVILNNLTISNLKK